MKKKLLILLLIVAMIIFATVGCRPQETPPPAPTETPEETPQETPPEAREMDYEDGTYQAELERDERGWQPTVEVIVEGGKITEVNYEEFDEEGNPKSENDEYNQQWESVAGTNALEAYPALEEQLIEVQDIEAVDTIAGATATAESFKEVVVQAMEAGPQ